MNLKMTLLSDGYCVQLENMAIRGGRFRQVRFASLFALIEHPRLGPVLFDTGYTRRFFEETRSFPGKLYAMVTPVQLTEAGDVVAQLRRRNIDAADVRHVIVSHFHADHIGGLRDFPNASFHCTRAAFSATKALRGLRAVRNAFLPGLMPDDFEKRALFAEDAPHVPLPARYAPFTNGSDLFGDGSMLAVELPGHTTGQMGVFLTSDNGTDCLLAADACWLSRSYRENRLPHPLVRLLSNWPVLRETMGKLHQLHCSNPALQIIPSHCPEINKGIQ